MQAYERGITGIGNLVTFIFAQKDFPRVVMVTVVAMVTAVAI